MHEGQSDVSLLRCVGCGGTLHQVRQIKRNIELLLRTFLLSAFFAVDAYHAFIRFSILALFLLPLLYFSFAISWSLSILFFSFALDAAFLCNGNVQNIAVCSFERNRLECQASSFSVNLILYSLKLWSGIHKLREKAIKRKLLFLFFIDCVCRIF